MAKKKTENVEKQYIVTIKKNKTFCGEGAGGAQFAHGTATITQMNGLLNGLEHMKVTKCQRKKFRWKKFQQKKFRIIRKG